MDNKNKKGLPNAINIIIIIVSFFVMIALGVVIYNNITQVEGAKPKPKGYTFENDKWSIDDGVLLKYKGYTDDLAILYGVTTIGEQSVQGNRGVRYLFIPETVTTIQHGAFDGCKNLLYVETKKDLKDVAYNAFDNTPLMTDENGFSVVGDFLIIGDGILMKYFGNDSEVVIPEDVKVISGAFRDNKTIKSVTLPESITKIGECAFANCTNLSNIELSDNISTIESSAFDYCQSLTEIHIPQSVQTTDNKQIFTGCTNMSQQTRKQIDDIFGKQLYDMQPENTVSSK